MENPEVKAFNTLLEMPLSALLSLGRGRRSSFNTLLEMHIPLSLALAVLCILFQYSIRDAGQHIGRQ